MLGLIVSGLYFAYLAFMGGAASPEAAFLQASHFLYIWYWVTGSIGACLAAGLIVVSLGLIGAGAAVGRGAGLVGTLVGVGTGAAVGGLIAVLTIVRIVVRSALLIGGTFLMMSSGTTAMAFNQFDLLRLGIGAGMVLIGLIFFRTKRGSSKNNND